MPGNIYGILVINCILKSLNTVDFISTPCYKLHLLLRWYFLNIPGKKRHDGHAMLTRVFVLHISMGTLFCRLFPEDTIDLLCPLVLHVYQRLSILRDRSLNRMRRFAFLSFRCDSCTDCKDWRFELFNRVLLSRGWR